MKYIREEKVPLRSNDPLGTYEVLFFNLYFLYIALIKENCVQHYIVLSTGFQIPPLATYVNDYT
jgi:hypothetical protein